MAGLDVYPNVEAVAGEETAQDHAQCRGNVLLPSSPSVILITRMLIKRQAIGWLSSTELRA